MANSQAIAPARLSKSQNILARVGITLAAIGLFCLLRQDIAAKVWNDSTTYAVNETRRLNSPSIIKNYLKDNTVRKLQIGAGDFNKVGWLNTDIEPIQGQAYVDATERFPLPDASFQLVYGEQLIEHLSYEQGLGMMKESFRILEHGGKVRLATPNLLKLVALLGDEKSAELDTYIRAKTDWHDWKQTPDPASYIINSEMHEFGHRFVYTPKMLRSTLEAAGFTQIRQYESGESDDAALKGIEVRSHSSVKDIDRYETMVFEGVRP